MKHKKVLMLVLDICELLAGIGLLVILIARWFLFKADPSISYVFLYIFGIAASVVSSGSGIVHLTRDIYDI